MHYYTFAIGAVPEELQATVDHNVETYGMELVHLPELNILEGVELVEAIIIAADCYRWERAAKVQSMDEIEGYLDLDCLLKKPMDDIEPDALPYWPLDNPAATPQPDTFIMKVSPGFARDIIALAKIMPGGMEGYCWPRRALRDMGGINQIDPSYYEHTMYSVNRRRELRCAAKQQAQEEQDGGE